MTGPGPDAEFEPFLTPHDEVDPKLLADTSKPTASAWNWGGEDMTPGGPNDRPKPDVVSSDAPQVEFRAQVQCHHSADGTDTDEDGHLWDPAGDCPSQPHAYVPNLPEAERSPRTPLAPVLDGHVAVEVDFVLNDGEDLHAALEQDKGTWALGCNLELVQEHGPAGGAAVLRLSGPPESVKGALIRYCGGDPIEAANIYGPGFTEHSVIVTPGNS